MATTQSSLHSPEVDHVELGKTTRKVMNRLAPFCKMKETSLERINSTSSNSSPPPTVPSSTFSSPAITPSASLSGLPTFDEHRSTAAAATSSVIHPAVLSPQAKTKLVNKISTRVIRIVSALDAHIHSGQVAFKMCREGMVLCDEDVRGGSSRQSKALESSRVSRALSQANTDDDDSGLVVPETPTAEMKIARRKLKGKDKEDANYGKDDGWDVDIDPDEADDRGVAVPLDEEHKYGTSGHHFLLHYARQGWELARRTEETFNEVRQEAYKIAAQTKDHNIPVLVPSAPGQLPSVRKHLSEVGLDLVANVKLLESDFGRKVKDTVAWWQWVIDDLEKGQQSALCPINAEGDTASSDKEALKNAYGWWEAAKDGWQAYYDIIATLHIVYHDLLLSSARAWDGTTVVVKAHQDSNEHLPPNSNAGNGDLGYELLEKQSVPRTLSAVDISAAQDKAAGSRVKGFLMWKAPYTLLPSSSGGKDSSGKKKAGKWAKWKAVGRRDIRLGLGPAVESPKKTLDEDNARGDGPGAAQDTDENNSKKPSWKEKLRQLGCDI